MQHNPPNSSQPPAALGASAPIPAPKPRPWRVHALIGAVYILLLAFFCLFVEFYPPYVRYSPDGIPDRVHPGYVRRIVDGAMDHRGNLLLYSRADLAIFRRILDGDELPWLASSGIVANAIQGNGLVSGSYFAVAKAPMTDVRTLHVPRDTKVTPGEPGLMTIRSNIWCSGIGAWQDTARNKDIFSGRFILGYAIKYDGEAAVLATYGQDRVSLHGGSEIEIEIAVDPAIQIVEFDDDHERGEVPRRIAEDLKVEAAIHDLNPKFSPELFGDKMVEKLFRQGWIVPEKKPDPIRAAEAWKVRLRKLIDPQAPWLDEAIIE